jgi:hypothetical protein
MDQASTHVDADGEGLLDHAVDRDFPWPDRQDLGLLMDILGRPELVVIVVGRRQELLGHVAVEAVTQVALNRIEPGRGIFLARRGDLGPTCCATVGLALVAGREQSRRRQQDRPRGQRLDQPAAIMKHGLRRGRRLRQLPTALDLDQHGTLSTANPTA